MPVKISSNDLNKVATAQCYGTLTKDDVCESMLFAFDAGRLKPNMDRIVTFDEDVALHELDLEALMGIRSRVLEEELHRSGAARFRSVLVCSTAEESRLMRLYKAVWDLLHLPDVHFFVVESEREAWRILTEDSDVKPNVAAD